mgnify:CR=1 FL=1
MSTRHLMAVVVLLLAALAMTYDPMECADGTVREQCK